MGPVKETAAGFCEKQVAGLTDVTRRTRHDR
jgi:hypothetical protein